MRYAIALFFAAILPFLAPCDIRAVVPDAWGGKPDCWQLKRHAQKMETVASGGARIVFVGDSITQGWEKKGKIQLAKLFPPGERAMLNLGTSADRTEHVLWRIREGGELDGYEAAVVHVMIGTNNTGHFPFEKEPPSDTILGVREVLKTVREKQPNAVVVLSSIFPRGEKPDDPKRCRNDVVNAEIQKLCDTKNGVYWCDFSDDYLELDGTLPKAVFPDFLHPVGAGYETWYRAVAPYIDYALSGRSGAEPKSRAAIHHTSVSPVPGVPAAATPATRIRREGYGAFDWWLDRLLRNRNAIADCGGEFDVVFAGDSITHNWEKQGKAVYEALRKRYSILDIGYSGDRTQHLLWRCMNGELDGYRTKCVMLMIGTNNSKSDSAEDTAKGIRRILDVIAEKQPDATVLLLPIFPRGFDAANPDRVKNDAVNAIAKGFADGKKVVWLDFGAKFLDENASTAAYMKDGVHPNAEGYRLWAEAVLPHFKRICGK